MKCVFLQKRRGFAVLETVIALVLIFTVSMTGLHVMITASAVEARNQTRFFAAALAEDTLACFRFSEDEQTLSAALEMLDGDFSHQPGSGIYRLDRSSFAVTVTADFETRQLSYRAVKPNGDVIYEFRY